MAARPDDPDGRDGAATPAEPPSDDPLAEHSAVGAASPLASRIPGKIAERLAPYRDRPAVALVSEIIERDRDGAGSVVGSAIAFRLFLFFVPLLLFVVGVAGLLSGHVDPDTVAHDAGVTGSLDTQIRVAFHQQAGTGWLALLLGLLGMATAGRSLSRALVATSYRAWGMPIRSKASWRVVGSIAGLVGGMGLVSILVNRVREVLGLGGAGLSFIPALALYAVAWFVISLLLPRDTEDPGALLPGAAVVAITIVAMQAVSQFYLPGRFERAGELYGAIGSTVVTLGWFFILGRAIVVAVELNPVVFDRYGSLTGALFALPVIRILPRRSPRLRRLFGIDDPA